MNKNDNYSNELSQQIQELARNHDVQGLEVFVKAYLNGTPVNVSVESDADPFIIQPENEPQNSPNHGFYPFLEAVMESVCKKHEVSDYDINACWLGIDGRFQSISCFVVSGTLPFAEKMEVHRRRAKSWPQTGG